MVYGRSGPRSLSRCYTDVFLTEVAPPTRAFVSTVGCALAALSTACAHGALPHRIADSAVSAATTTFVNTKGIGALAYGVAVDGRDASPGVIAALRRSGMNAIPYSRAHGPGCKGAALIAVTAVRPVRDGGDWVVVTNETDIGATNCVSLASHRCLFEVNGGIVKELKCEYFAIE
jgi:hypothetical protein